MQATDVFEEPFQPAAQKHVADEIVYQIMKTGQLSTTAFVQAVKWFFCC
jgi:hypothetical protein